MGIKIFHTGDIHIGMGFNNYPDHVRKKLSEARFNVLEKMINKSNDLNSDIFLVAGDMFNTIQIRKKDINRTIDILGKFNGACVLVLPGNHDYDNGAIELWDEFTSIDRDNILLINEKKPYHLKDYQLDIVIYPAPCHSKHSEENSLQWIKDRGLMDEGRYHIGVGHGALEGLSPDIEGNYYHMSMSELNSLPMDLWLLGHTHVRYPLVENIEDHRIYNAGTPEPDGLDYKGEGSAWFISLAEEKVTAERIITGEYIFHDKEFHLDKDEDLKEVKEWALEGKPDKKIIRLSLKGSISEEKYRSISDFYGELEDVIFHLIIEDSDLKIKVNREIIEREFTQGSFPYEFLTELSQDEEALQIAYDLLRRE